MALALTLMGAILTSPAVHGAGEQGSRLLHVPMRWCVLAGTDAADESDEAVLARIRRASGLWAPRAAISLRSAVNRSFLEERSFPVIADPSDQYGRNGDVLDPTVASGEYKLVRQRCHRAWQRLRGQFGETRDFDKLAKGPIGVVIRDFVDEGGSIESDVWGYAYAATTNGDYCPDLRITSAHGGSMLVVDSWDGTPGASSDQRLVAHEAGHILRLGHGNGEDDDGNGPFDKFCDPGEDDGEGSLMGPSLGSGFVRPLQTTLARHVAAKHPSVLIDPPMALEPYGAIGDDVPDELDDVISDGVGPEVAAAVDLDWLAYGYDLATGVSEFVIATSGPIDAAPVSEFVVLADSDADPGSGSWPGDLDAGYGSYAPQLDGAGTEGVDLVVALVAEYGSLRGQAWRYDPASEGFVDVGSVETSPLETTSEDGVALWDGVRMAFDGYALGLFDSVDPLSSRINAQALSRAWADDGSMAYDVIDTVLDGYEVREMVPLSLQQPEFPLCAVTSQLSGVEGRGDPGAAVTLEVTGFDALDAAVSIYLGETRLEPFGESVYSAIGDDIWTTEVLIPEDATQELQVISVVVEGTALTADCPVLVGEAKPPVTDD